MSEPQANVSPRPWHREPWPWFIIGLLSAAVIASLITLWIALANPDYRVIDDAEYDRVRSEMRAQDQGEEGTSGNGDG